MVKAGGERRSLSKVAAEFDNRDPAVDGSNLAQQVEDRVAARCTKLPPPAKFFGGLAALKRTLVQEQKSLLRSSDRLRLIHVQNDDSKFCRKCGRPFNSEPSDGMQDELMQ